MTAEHPFRPLFVEVDVNRIKAGDRWARYADGLYWMYRQLYSARVYAPTVPGPWMVA